MKRRPRVLVVDDSAFARAVLSRLIGAAGDIEVVGSARDGSDALMQIDALDPDVVTLDLTMPHLDGMAVLRQLAGRPRPRVLVVSISNVDTERGAEALALGAIDIIAKPSALASERLNEIGDELVAKVRAAAASFLEPKETELPQPPPRPRNAERAELVMIGTSTGGPQALTRLVNAFPADLAAPVVMVLHIPIGYTEALSKRLDRTSKVDVIEASEGLELRPGLVVLARAGMHLRVSRDGPLRAHLGSGPTRPFTPSVDEMFLSGAKAMGKSVLGVVLTGMGDDGLEGARAISSAGGSLLIEAASTCVVYGMPRVVYEAGLGAIAVPLDRMAEEIVKRV
jgi:two-component system chemotaxis response regulator CheB